jgi:hypothetical protein
MKNITFLFFLVCVLSSSNLWGLEGGDTVFTYSSLDKPFFSFSINKWNARDTGINNIQIYQPAFKNSITNTFAGNIGLAVRSILPSSEYKLGFRTEKSVFGIYFINPDEVTYYNTRKPFTSVDYVQGSKKEQVIKITHTQNLNPLVNIGFVYNRVKSDGFFARQNSSYNNVVFFSSGQSKSNRFAYLSNVTYNKLVAYENWGIVPDSSFETIGFGNKSLLNVNNTGAQNNRWLYGAYFKPYFNLWKTTRSDTINKTETYTARIFMEGKITRSAKKYFDPLNDKTFYNTLNYDSLYTNDSTVSNILNTYVGFETNEFNTNGAKRKLRWSVKSGLEWFDALNYSRSEINGTGKLKSKYTGGKSDYNSLIDLNLCYSPDSGRVKTLLNAQYIISGYNQGDRIVNLDNVLSNVGTSGSVFLNANLSSRRPDYFQTNYFANALIFSSNSFVNINLTNIETGYRNRQLRLEAKIAYRLFDNFIYFDFASKPKQLSKTQDLLSIHVIKHFSINKFHLNVNFIYNATSFDALRIPRIITFNSLYLENRVFKKSTLGQIGFDLRYLSGTEGLAYNPVLANYFLSNGVINNYPYLDFFLNFKVSTFKLFFKVEHLNAGLIGNNYFTLTNLPMHDRAIRIGINWTFHY